MPIKPAIDRREFLKYAGGTLAVSAGLWKFRDFLQAPRLQVPGQMMGANSKVGHWLRDGVQATPTETRRVGTLIVGGGMSGLSAAWWLQRNGYQDFLLLEMDSEVGGNSRAGENSISKYPWGAHYVPLPGEDAHYVRELFQELGLIKGQKNGLPVYDEYYLCADPHERLYYQGEWQEGLVPSKGLRGEDKIQYQQFFSYLEFLKNQKGKDGKPVFNIPLELSSQDPKFLKLDQISMSEWMFSKGWSSKSLHWYVNYCCRDDYGAPHSRVSAWAGLHYFASRSGSAANADSQTVITWPEGNAWLAQKLKDKVKSHIQTQQLVFQMENQNRGCQVDVLHTETQVCTRYQAEHVIYCGPHFTANRIIKAYKSAEAKSLEYYPWLVANVSLKSKPAGEGAQLSWDNVSYYSNSLGYIVANHQDLKINRREAVITYYLPLDEKSAKEERLAAYKKSFQDWMDLMIPDLEKMHPGISKQILNVEAWVWGHGMVNPGIDFLWSSKRQALLKDFGAIQFAHTDMSGISIFEEAQYRGVEAAKKILKKSQRAGLA